jgi:adenine nucleotide transporter 17
MQMTQVLTMKTKSPSPLAHAISGSLGSAFALLLLYPLERARTELQASADYACQEPGDDPEEDAHHSPKSSSSSDSWITCSPVLRTSSQEAEQQDIVIEQSSFLSTKPYRATRHSLWDCLHDLYCRGEIFAGVGPVVSTFSASNFVFFLAHQIMKQSLYENDSRLSRALMASSLAGAINVLLTNPLWVANLRFVQGRAESKNLWSEIHFIARTEGISNLWSGTQTSLLLVANPVLQFFCYEQLKHLTIRRRHDRSLSSAQAFGLGFLAKAIATLVTYPLQLAQVLQRLHHYNGTMDCLQQVCRHQGPAALYMGLQAKLWQTTLTAAITFLTYEQILQAVHKAIVIVTSKRR